MKGIKRHLPWFVGIFSGVLFLALLGVRSGVFFPEQAPISKTGPVAAGKESWMEIFRKDQKIGYTHRLLSKRENGFHLRDHTYLRLNVMGMVQDMRIQTSAMLDGDLKLSSFSFELGSGLFEIAADGHITDTTLHATINGEEARFQLKEPVYLLSGIFSTAKIASLAEGETATFYVFDPATMGRSPVRVTRVQDETLSVAGTPTPTTRYTVETMGLKQSAWTNATGEVVKETGLMGIKLVKSTKDAVLDGFRDAGPDDLTESISIAVNRAIPDPVQLKKLTLDIGGARDLFFLDGGRQTFQDGRLTVVKEEMSSAPPPGRTEDKAFLSPTLTIQSDHPEIRRLAAALAPEGTPPLAAIEKIMAWMDQNIEKRPVISFPNALSTLENRMGDCNEHAVLFAALARSAGIPTQVEAGLVYMNKRFYYHAWNVVYLGDWITVDALMGQIPADVTHIRLVRGDEMNQLDLVHAIDAIQLTILEMQ